METATEGSVGSGCSTIRRPFCRLWRCRTNEGTAGVGATTGAGGRGAAVLGWVDGDRVEAGGVTLFFFLFLDFASALVSTIASSGRA